MSNFVGKISYAEFMRLSPMKCCEKVFRHKVLVIEAFDKNLNDFQNLMAKLGEPVHHVLENLCVPGCREVLKISNLYRNGIPVGVHEGGAYWHTDMSYSSRNTVFTALFASKVPAIGGGTEFIDCAAGWQQICESLPERGIDIKPKQLTRLQVEHVFGNRARQQDLQANEQRLTEHQRASLPDCVRHPLVLRHPYLGIPSIYAAAATSVGVDGMPRDESLRILDILFNWLVAEAPRYEHTYTPGDIVIWDNLSTLHRGPDIPATEDESDYRLLYRINVDYSRVLPLALPQVAPIAKGQ